MEPNTLRPLPVIIGGQTYDLCLAADPEEPLARDLDVAKWLGYQDVHKIRELITRHAEDLGPLVSATVAETPGRPGRTYYLTEEQVLYLIAKSETPRAGAVLKDIIRVYIAVRKGMMQGADPAQVAALHAEVKRMKAEVAELSALSAQVPALVGAVRQLQAGAGRRNKKAERQLQQLTLTLQAQAAQPARRPDAMAAAKAYLLAALQAGPVRATEVEAGAKAVGVNRASLKRARDKMQIKSFRCGGIGAGGHWWWSLPPAGGAS